MAKRNVKKEEHSRQGKFTYRYPRPMLTVDSVILSRMQGRLKVLLIKRKNPPYQHCLALPGGFVNPNEQTLTAAYRELAEETSLRSIKLKCVGVFDAPGRDPRGWNVSLVHLGLAKPRDLKELRPADDAEELDFYSLNTRVKLAFDHNLILRYVSRYIKKHNPKLLSGK